MYIIKATIDCKTIIIINIKTTCSNDKQMNEKKLTT